MRGEKRQKGMAGSRSELVSPMMHSRFFNDETRIATAVTAAAAAATGIGYHSFQSSFQRRKFGSLTLAIDVLAYSFSQNKTCRHRRILPLPVSKLHVNAFITPVLSPLHPQKRHVTRVRLSVYQQKNKL